MLTDTQTLNASTYLGAATSTVFDKRSEQNGVSAFTDASVASTTPRLITLSHEERTVSGHLIAGHLVRYEQTFFPAIGGNKATPYISVVLKEPIGVVEVTQAVIEDMIGNALAFTIDNIDKIRNGES